MTFLWPCCLKQHLGAILCVGSGVSNFRRLTALIKATHGSWSETRGQIEWSWAACPASKSKIHSSWQCNAALWRGRFARGGQYWHWAVQRKCLEGFAGSAGPFWVCNQFCKQATCCLQRVHCEWWRDAAWGLLWQSTFPLPISFWEPKLVVLCRWHVGTDWKQQGSHSPLSAQCDVLGQHAYGGKGAIFSWSAFVITAIVVNSHSANFTKTLGLKNNHKDLNLIDGLSDLGEVQPQDVPRLPTVQINKALPIFKPWESGHGLARHVRTGVKLDAVLVAVVSYMRFPMEMVQPGFVAGLSQLSAKERTTQKKRAHTHPQRASHLSGARGILP